MTRRSRSLATTTGGQFFTFSGTEPFPDLETYFQPLRYNYQLSYTSRIQPERRPRPGGARQRRAIRSPATTDGQPDRPAAQPDVPVAARPGGTQLGTPSGSAGGQTARQRAPTRPPAYWPAQRPPEHHGRIPGRVPAPLKAARLYVDGKLASELTARALRSPSIGRWRDTPASGHHSLRVEVEDQLGLVHSSIETPVELVVDAPAALRRADHFWDRGRQTAAAGRRSAGGRCAGHFGRFGLFRRLRARRKASPRRRAAPARPRLKMPVPLPAVRRISIPGQRPGPPDARGRKRPRPARQRRAAGSGRDHDWAGTPKRRPTCSNRPR